MYDNWEQQNLQFEKKHYYLPKKALLQIAFSQLGKDLKVAL